MAQHYFREDIRLNMHIYICTQKDKENKHIEREQNKQQENKRKEQKKRTTTKQETTTTKQETKENNHANLRQNIDW